MIGNAAASEAFDQAFPDKVYRYVNVPDPVPKLPTMSLVANDYCHCQKEIALDDGSGSFELARAFAGQAAESLFSTAIITEVWAAIQARVAAHGLDHYRKLIEQAFRDKA
jgi:hypothetical protein